MSTRIMLGVKAAGA